MPTVAVIDGLKIMFYANDHGLPHFHVMAGGHEAAIRIDTLLVIEGSLTRSQLRRVAEWAEPRKEALGRAWANMRIGVKPERIA